MQLSGVDPLIVSGAVVPLAAAALKLASKAMEPWLERAKRRAALPTPMEQLVQQLEEHSKRQDEHNRQLSNEVDRLWKQDERREQEHREEIETAREAAGALQTQHEECEKKLGSLQEQVGELRQEVTNLRRQVGIETAN